MFRADTIDDLTIEQYNILVELWNYNAENQPTARPDKRTVSIRTVPGNPGVNYGDE